MLFYLIWENTWGLAQKGPRHKSHWVADWPAQLRWHQKPPKNVRPSEKNVQQSEKECLVIGEKCRDSAKCQEAAEGYNWLPQMEHLSFLHRMKMRTRVFSEASLQSPIRQVLPTPTRCQRPHVPIFPFSGSTLGLTSPSEVDEKKVW